jgi:murein DD-endopeptidase MepM/ murein hydrolase activator NlpD
MRVRSAGRAWLVAAVVGLLSVSTAGAASPGPFRLPVDCEWGVQCFLQQMADVDPSREATDPFCGRATYDGHDGIDIRLRSMRDIVGGYAVVAAAPGRIRGSRDGVDDHILRTESDRRKIAGRECGNGVVIIHADGLETQYCHMRKGSVIAREGELVDAGQKLGEIGSSGLAQFPHVHFSVRRNGRKIDPIGGGDLTAGCNATGRMTDTLLQAEAAQKLAGPATSVLGMGLASAAVDHDSLVETGGPATPPAGGSSTLAWAWLANLEEGDVVVLRMIAPHGSLFFENTGAPVAGHKASYSFYLGRRVPVVAGIWELAMELRRGETIALSRTERITVK